MGPQLSTQTKNMKRKARIIGVEEARLELNEIFCISPVAPALMKA